MARGKSAPISGEILTDEEIAQLEAGRAMMALPDVDQFGTAEDDPDDVALANVVAELGSDAGDAVVNVYQIDEKKNRAFVGSFAPADFSIGLIQSQFGAGEYRVEVRQNKKWLKKSTVRIAAPKNPPISAQAVPAAIETGKIIESMQAGFQQMGQMFAQALGGLAANQPKPKSTMEMLQEMQLMKQIMGGNEPAPGPDPMQLFEMATNIAEKIHPRESEPGTGEIILNAIKEFGPVFAKAANSAPTPGTIPVPPTAQMMSPVPVAMPTPAAISGAPETPHPTQEDEMNLAKRFLINMLLGAAKAGADTEHYANLILDQIGDDAALQFVNAPGWWETLVREVPAAADHRAWVEQLRSDILELTRPDEPAMNTGNATS